ncbi:disulfide isomerase DsbC N-terminal domain-containing protein [Sedimenticola hydrogenitrophicus]|uniref:disulfide isomerase DsbC N-terminal domain-containing protein n=1 Tax=Sedimenticola hydrogenitrophicus TaxID=2967975 RepID=UPI0023B076BF|nr:disulfide isomerase DsbC N-terminal domain-containing protein [Sedimenticola hydrogenitrophicus]
MIRLTRLFRWLVPWLLLSVSSALGAAPSDDRQIARVRQSLALLLPDVLPDSISPTPIPGLFEVVVGTRLVYVTGDGRYLIEGEITDLEQQKNLTNPRLNEVTVAAVDAIGEQNMLIFEPAEPARYSVTVFTDIDSAYSRKLHQEIEQYTRRGIRVRYLFYPRAGLESRSFDKAVAVWCSPDRSRALRQAMAGEAVEAASCAHPVGDHWRLGGRMGISGAPVMVLENGDMLPGYVSAERLHEILGKMQRLKP